MKHEFNEIEDILGKQFRNWTVLKFIGLNPQKRRVFLCKCICGQEKPVRADVIVGQKTIGCGCLTRQRGNKNPLWRGCGELGGAKWAVIKNAAKKRNLPFNVSLQEAWDLFLKQDRKCALTGLPLTLPAHRNDFSSNASFDRIDSSKGYEIGNVQWVDKNVNLMKLDFPQGKFIEYCQLVAKFYERHQSNM